MGGEIAVLVVDDSPFIRSAVQRMLEPLQAVRIVGTAADGREAIRLARELRPDVIILDIVMPGMNGLEAIRGIMEEAPTAILVLSSHARPGADVTLRALDLGAVDFISKSDANTRMDIYDLAPVLREKVLAVAGAEVGARARPDGALAVAATAAAPSGEHVATRGATERRVVSRYDILAIGASTGGPRALALILPALPADFPAGIVVAQHMPPGFTTTLADRLDRRCALEVREAADGDRIAPGTVLIGPGGHQLRVERDGGDLVARVPEDGERMLYRPSVDYLMESVASVVGARAVGVVLTGMGEDGARGLEAVRSAGGRTLAESEESAVIFGMPRAAGPAAERVVSLERMPGVIRAIFEGREP